MRSRDNEIQSLRSQLDSHRNEINELRARLGMPLLVPSGTDASGLGLVVPRPVVDGWDAEDDDPKEA